MSICNLLKNKIPLLNPIIEVYIFNVLSIKNPLKYNQIDFALHAKQKFGKLYFSKDINGIIYPNSYSYKNKNYNFNINDIYNNNRVYTSDILTSTLSQRGGDINNLKDFYIFYKLHLTKELEFINKKFSYTVKNIFYTGNRINDIVTTINKATYIIQKIHLKKNIISNIYDNIINDAFIFNINLDKNDKVVIFGDFHGSFHSFFRIFLRLHYLKIIDFENYVINPGYIIIFLGDIADRGQYALEIYYIICKFICKNNNDPNNLKIILNRGNHEDPILWSSYGFKEELDLKFNFIKLKPHILDLLKVCSSGIVLTYKDKNQYHRYWLSHGGIPVIVNNNIFKISDDRCIHIKDTSNITKFDSFPNFIRWCDYHSKISNFTHDINHNGIRHIISPKNLLDFLKINNIDFVIRGHTDNTENAYLFSNIINKNCSFSLNNPDIYTKNKNSEFIKFPEKILTHKISNKIKKINGPVSIINTKGWYNKSNSKTKFIVKMKDSNNKEIDIYPVLTISTNSDNERTLNKDSFVILNMNQNINKLKTNNNLLTKINS